jgi:hypothetical protein
LHAVLIYGWDDIDQSWLCKNSWGRGWGEQGHFRIKYGEANMGTPVIMIWDETSGSPVIGHRPDRIDLRLSPGEKTIRYLTIRNEGSGQLEFDVDIQSDYMPLSGERTPFDNWLSVPFGTGTVGAGDSILIPVKISASSVASGDYRATIQIQNNDFRRVPANTTVNLFVEQPEHDVAVMDVSLPLNTWPRYLFFEPTTTLKNWGLSDNGPLVITCQMYDAEGTLLYSDSANVTTMDAGVELNKSLSLYSFTEPGEYKMRMTCQVPEDNNEDNNIYEKWFQVIDYLEDFEQPTDIWDFGQGWGITDDYNGGHQSEYAAHVNSGQSYTNDIDNSLTLKYGLDLSGFEAASLVFWTRYAMEKNSDYLYVQARSESGTEWMTLESFTGIDMRWQKKVVTLEPFSGIDKNRVFIRFRFISDQQTTYMGPLIDDLAIIYEPVVVGAWNKNMNQQPEQVRLFQNFPNPFNPETRISYYIPKPAYVTIRIINLQGQVVDVLVGSRQTPAIYHTLWRPEDLASGVYFYHLTAECENGECLEATKKLLYIK